MRTRTSLLNGDPVTIDVPDGELTPPVRTSVLIDAGLELEVNAGDASVAAFYFDSTRSTPGASVRLRGGQLLRAGRLGGDPSAGLAYWIDDGGEALFGAAAPSLDLESLARVFASAGIGRGPRGVRLAPGGDLGWSPYRTHDLNQTVRLGGDQAYLLDVRRIAPGAPRVARGPGLAVRGGRLTRSAPDTPSHVVLEAAEFVAFGVPVGRTGLDRMATSMSRVEVTRQ